jgi:hypothetical protein
VVLRARQGWQRRRAVQGVFVTPPGEGRGKRDTGTSR